MKKPLSAYMLFNNHRRPVLKEEYPEYSVPDISKLIGEEWKKLSENQHKPWIDKANDLRL
ncbi:MAG: HMG-box domain-containing protein [bacterium]